MMAMTAQTAAKARRPHPLSRLCFAYAQGATKKKQTAPFLDGDREAMAIHAAGIGAITKGAAPLGTTTDAGWAAEIAQTAALGFLASLGPYAGSRIVAGAVPAVVGANASVTYPQRAADPAALSWCGEGGAIPVRQYDFDAITLGPSRKLATILVWTEELAKRSDAASIFDVMLREDASCGLDAGLFSTAAGSGSVVAGLLNGVAATPSSVASGRTAIEEDLAALAETVAVGGTGDFVVAMNPKRLARLKVVAPDLAEKLNIAPSAALADTRVVAVDPQGILFAVDPDVDIMASKYATVHMESAAPLPIVDGATADPVRSNYQTGTISFRAIFEVAWSKRRSNAAAYCDAVAWW